MAEEKLLTVREVSTILGISEKEVMDLAENLTIPAYKVGGVYLRFRRIQVMEYKKSTDLIAGKGVIHEEYFLKDKLSDFFYFNDFYILTFILIVVLLVVIIR